MFLTTKLNLLSGMIIGASAVLLMKEMCKGRCKQKHKHKHEHDSTPMEPEQNAVTQKMNRQHDLPNGSPQGGPFFIGWKSIQKTYWRIGLVRFDASKGTVDAGLTLTHFGGGSANELLAVMLTLNSWRSECKQG